MNRFSMIKKAIPFFLFLVFLTGWIQAEEVFSQEGWTRLLGRKVDVDYEACTQTGCVLVRNAELKEVNDKAIIVILRGSPFLIPKYMIKRVALSSEQGQRSKSD